MDDASDLTDVTPTPGPVAVRATVTGEVQGVAYRWYAAQRAEELGLVGWVRNEADGSVAAHLEGPREAVDTMLDWCRQGPPSARVAEVVSREADLAAPSSFEIRH